MSKNLIINADDFGFSKIFNESILDVIRNDQIKSTTVMVDRVTDDQKDQFDELINLSKTKNISIGLHIEFTSDDYKSQIESQFNKFKEILGFQPSHIDIHKGFALSETYEDVVNFCNEHNLPTRNEGVSFENIKTTSEKVFFGSIPDFSEIKTWTKSFEEGKS